MNEEEKSFYPMAMFKLMNKEFPPLEWLIEGLIPIGGITAFCGYPGSFKTWIMLDLAISLAQGGIFLGKFKTKKEKVLIIDEENGERSLKKRLELLTTKKNLDIELLSFSDFKLKDTNKIIKYCLDNKIGVVMIDSLIRVHGLKDENSSAEAAKIFDEFKEFKKNDISLILLCHNRKSSQSKESTGEELRGSSEIFAFLDCALSFQKKKDEIIVKQTKLRNDEESSPFIIKVIKGERTTSFEFMNYVANQNSQKKSEMVEEKIMALLESRGGELFRQEIFSTLEDFTSYSIKNGLANLTATRKIDCVKEAGNNNVYSIKKD